MKTSSLAVLFVISTAQAYEVDNFTRRAELEKLPDSMKTLDVETNRRLKSALQIENPKGTCPRDLDPRSHRSLYNTLRQELDSNPVAEIEDWAVTHCKGANDDGDIYTGSGFSAGVVRFLAGFEPTIRVGGHILGVDKLGHFMSQGYDYFAKQLNGVPATEILDYGEALEDGRYGLETTGVKSYGDLSANYAGMSFWRDVIGGPNPFFACREGKYVQLRKFSWGDYVSDSWDEGVNCSSYNAKTAKAVSANLARAGQRCPLDTARCKGLAKMNCAHRLLSEECKTIIGVENLNSECLLAGEKVNEVTSLESLKVECIPTPPGQVQVEETRRTMSDFSPILRNALNAENETDALRVQVREPRRIKP